jgi:tetratricopeptide (TPR) repeat protein
MREGTALGVTILCLSFAARPVFAQDVKAISVDPVELARRSDLLGREVVVDDRVARFQYHPDTRLFDEVYLKRCPDVTFALPARLRFQQSPQAPAVRIQGKLRKDGERLFCDVTAIDLLPSDLDRLNRAVAMLPKADSENRSGWSRWAERRGRAFQDEVLLKRAREIEAEAIRNEAGLPGKDPVDHWLGLAERARAEKIPEPEPSALAHQGFRASLSRAANSEEAKAVVTRIEAFFPGASRPVPPEQEGDLARWEAPYAKDPAAAYRASNARARSALDHRLWADAVQRSIEKQAAENPKEMLNLAEDASKRLPDRPSLATKLLERGLGAESRSVGELRLSEVDSLATLYRERLKQPEKAKELYRSWLDDQRNHRLSPRDAEGRIALARQYEDLLDDRATATSLLRDAWSIDPGSREVADAFLRRGFRKVNGQWVEGSKARAARDATPEKGEGEATAADRKLETVNVSGGESGGAGRGSGATGDSLLNATPSQVLAKLAKPDRRVRIATQGRVIEQWIYFLQSGKQYINILHEPGNPQPRVISYYTLPRTASDAPSER